MLIWLARLAITAIDSYKLPVLPLISVVFFVSTQGLILLVRLLFILLILQGFIIVIRIIIIQFQFVNCTVDSTGSGIGAIPFTLHHPQPAGTLFFYLIDLAIQRFDIILGHGVILLGVRLDLAGGIMIGKVHVFCQHLFIAFFLPFEDTVPGVLIVSLDSHVFISVALIRIRVIAHQVLERDSGGFIIAQVIIQLRGVIFFLFQFAPAQFYHQVGFRQLV